MKSRGRPRISPVSLKDGFYIEICNPGVKRGMKIRSENRKAMDLAANRYAKDKDVIVLGEYKDGLPVVPGQARRDEP